MTIPVASKKYLNYHRFHEKLMQSKHHQSGDLIGPVADTFLRASDNMSVGIQMDMKEFLRLMELI